MPRIRSIHPGFPTDEDMIECSIPARLFFLLLTTEADDYGCFEWKPIRLKVRLFPADDVDIEKLLGELVAVDKVARYTSEGRQLGAIRNFVKFQRPKKPAAHCPRENAMSAMTGQKIDINNYIGLTKKSSVPVPNRDHFNTPSVPNQWGTGAEPTPSKTPTSTELHPPSSDHSSEKVGNVSAEGRKGGREERITTPNPSFDAEPADGPEPGGGFSDQDPEPDPETPAEDLAIGEVEHIPKPREPWAILGRDLLAMTRLDEKPKPISTAICAQWLRDWSEDDIRAAVSDAVERESYDPQQVGGLKYFEPAIKRHIEQRHAANRKEITDRVAGWNDTLWVSLAAKWRAGEMEWAPTLHGPAPDQTGFMGPASVAGPRVRVETTGGLRWDLVGHRVLAMTGLLDKAISIAPVKDWMDAGISGEAVLAAVKAVVDAPGYQPPRSLREFEPAVMARQEEAA